MAHLFSKTKSCSQKLSKGNRDECFSAEINVLYRISGFIRQLLHAELFLLYESGLSEQTFCEEKHRALVSLKY